MSNLFCFVSGYPTPNRAKNEVFSTAAPNGPITNNKMTRLQQGCKSSQTKNAATTPPVIDSPSAMAVDGACGPLRAIQNVMHF